MPNEIQIECYFKSDEIAKLCAESKDIIIHFKASFAPDLSPTFEISANSFTKGTKAGKSLKAAAKLTTPPPPGEPSKGCPTPCT